MKRGLNPDFEKDLLSGILKGVFDFVRKDYSLDLEIRENYVNIYYKGGNILKIAQRSKKYLFDFDYKYLTTDVRYLEPELKECLYNKNWLKYFAFAKHVMDLFFSVHRKEEREYQQLIVRENNYSSVSNGTDYFIIDIEYDNHENARFDIIALEWISEGSKRKLCKPYLPKIVIFEMKYGDGALSGKAGISKHMNDFSVFISNPDSVKKFKEEMLFVFDQKRRLGLIPCLQYSKNKHEVQNVSEEIELIFILANHDPASTSLLKELNSCNTFSASFITSNFFGYGLYKSNVFNHCDFMNHFSNQICEFQK